MEKQLEKLKEGLKDKVKSMETKIEEQESQYVFLIDKMGNMKIGGDLHIQKIKMEYESELENYHGNTKLELEFIKEDLQSR